MTFTWDDEKAKANLKKHGISFADATAVFRDPRALRIEDDHPDEMRCIALGMDALARLVVVSYTKRDGSVRLISARKATRSETATYGG